jgi:C-terminal processing protease CtpA/Prc
MKKRIFLPLLILLLPLFPSFGVHAAVKFGGVGIDGVPLPNGEILIRQLVAGSPAHRAGIHIGDIITHIDGIPTKGSNFREMVEKRLRGREGTKVRLTIRRPGQAKPLQFTIVRRELIVGGR